MHDHGYFCLQIMLVVFTFFSDEKIAAQSLPNSQKMMSP